MLSGSWHRGECKGLSVQTDPEKVVNQTPDHQIILPRPEMTGLKLIINEAQMVNKK